MLASIIVSIIEWILEKVFFVVKKDAQEHEQEMENVKQAETAVETFAKDKAAATTKKESADAGKNMLNS